MNWLGSKIDEFIRRIRDSHPIGADEHNPIAIGGELVDGKIIDPTYWRWFVIPRNRFVNFYLHNFLRDDIDDLHDHRMMNISVVLSRQGYTEEVYVRHPREGLPLPDTRVRRCLYLVPRIRLPATPHRVVLHRDSEGRPIAVWSLFIGLPHWRDWGFWCPGNMSARWVDHETYISDASDPTNSHYGVKGRGCG